MIHITIAGIGKFGMEACEKFQTRFVECYENAESGKLKVIVNRNELSVICNIEIANLIEEDADRLIPWNNQEIEAEERTRDILITIGDPMDLGYKMFHKTAVGLLGKPECKRIALIKGDNAVLENELLNQQLDHIIACDGIQGAVGILMILIRLSYIQNYDMCTHDRDEFRSLFGNCSGQIAISHKEKLSAKRPYTAEGDSTYTDDVCKLVEEVTQSVVGKVNVTKRYIAFVYVEGVWGLDLLGSIMECFRENIGGKQVADEILLFDKTIEYDRMIRNACTILLIEMNNIE